MLTKRRNEKKTYCQRGEFFSKKPTDKEHKRKKNKGKRRKAKKPTDKEKKAKTC